jgi:hypothetical protein
MPATRGGDDRVLTGQPRGVGIGEVREQGELDRRIDVRERLDLEVFDERVDVLHARDERRHDHHGVRVRRNLVGQLDTRQPAWRGDPRDQALDEHEAELTRGQEGDQRREVRHDAPAAGIASEQPRAGDDERGEQSDRA